MAKMLGLSGKRGESLQNSAGHNDDPDHGGAFEVNISSQCLALLTWALVGVTLVLSSASRAAEPAPIPVAATPSVIDSSEQAPAPEQCVTLLRDVDEFWQLSTRNLCGGATSDAVRSLAVHQYQRTDGQSSWTTRALDDFFQNERQCATVFFVHGNRVSADEAVAEGWQMYYALATNSTRPFRLVVWSWPSEQVRGPARDVRSKVARAEDEAHYFGGMLRRYDSDARVGIIGYSLGARIVTGGLHLASGGELDGESVGEPASDAPRYGVVLAAAAAHNHWLMPESRHGKALAQVDHLLNLYNSCDPVLARYRMIDRCEKPQALGYVGIAPASLGVWADRVSQRDLAPSIGKTHDENAYLYRGVTADELRRHLLPVPAANK